MNRYILLIALMIGLLLSMCPQAVFGDVSANEQDATVTMTITKLQVNDLTLELSWKIVNSSDHDVWICDSLDIYRDWRFDVFLTDDGQTLLIRRRFDIPALGLWAQLPYARYIRLRPGQERAESLSLIVPLIHNRRSLFADSPEITAEYVTRLVLEIGFYNEDLPGMIHGTLAVAEKIKSAGLDLLKEDPDITSLYFTGSWLDHYFGGLSAFDEANKNGNEEIEIPYNEQALMGEQVLRATVDGVAIPFGEVPATDEPIQSQIEPTDVTMAITGLDVNDQSLELIYKIKNVSDHEVWVCDNVGFGHRFEVYMATDDQTLMIRRRFEVPTAILYYVLPDGGYVRLRPDEERTESMSLTVPVQQDFVFTVGVGTAKRATRLILEVGFYDEDLPGLIRSILEEAEKIAGPTPNLDDHNISIIARYFDGLLIARYFGGLAGFEEYYYKDPSEQLRIPYMHQALGSEQVLRITIDGVSVPYSK